jgi:ABC-type multidrug transport system ATPase subunit
LISELSLPLDGRWGANDRILVLDHGEVVEFGTPWELIQKDGMFRELCRQSGEDTQLMEVSFSRLKTQVEWS